MRAPTDVEKFFEISLDVMAIANDKGFFVEINPAFAQTLGYQLEDVKAQPFTDLVHPDDLEATLESYAALGAGESAIGFENRYRCLDGSYKWLLWNASPIEGGRTYCTARDITHQRQADAALTQARAEIDQFFGLSLDPMVIANDAGHFVRVNPAFEKALGYTSEELVDRPFMEFIHPEDLEPTLATYTAQAAGGSVIGFENRYRCKDGSYRWLLWSATAMENGYVYATARDITERRQLEDAMREAEELLSLAFEHSPLGMTLSSPDRQVLRVNRAFAEILGHSTEELMRDRGPKRFTHPDDVAIDEAKLGKLLDGETDLAQWEKRYIHADRHIVWTLVSVSALRHADGSARLLISQIEDITMRKRAESELALATEQAIEASRQKSEFVASMSHELRTPLNGVIGMTDLLRDTRLDPTQIQYVDALGASGEALLSVISAVLDFSKIEAGRLELDRTDFELRSAVEEASQMLAEQAHSKGLEIGHTVDSDVPGTVNGDHARLRQILLNLLSNAVKFTTSGDVRVRVRRDGPDQLHFAVTDTGVGIDAEQASALFEAFVQADQSTTRQYGGTGLGLAISRQLVGLMGGEIGAEPREDGGSTFWFTATLPEVCGAAEPVQARQDLRSLRTLVVDDNASNRAVLEHYLRDCGLACESVDRPSTAIAVLERASREGQPFELAMIDVNMPQMNAMELAREIRERPALDALRIVILSSGAFEPDKFEGMRVSAVLRKPARQSSIYEAIAQAFSGASPQTEQSQSTEAAPPRRGLLVLVAEDNEINTIVIRALLTKLGLEMAFAENGREAIEMAAGRNYDLIFMDCLMPEVDGFQATREIRKTEHGRTVPIIAMTALSMPGDRDRCVAAGMDDYLSKPIRSTSLGAVVRRWLPDEQAAPGALGGTEQDEPAGGSNAQPVRVVLDQAVILQLRETLTPEVREHLVDTFLAQQEECIAEIAAALEHEDRGEIRRVAHILKGSSASLGAMRLRHCCERFEHIGRAQDQSVGQEQLVELSDAAAQAGKALRTQLS